MPKNLHGGNKHKKGKNKKLVTDNIIDPKLLILAQENQVYALVKKRMGGSYLSVECSDKKIRSALLPGKFKKRVWIYPGDIILCDLGAKGDDDSCLVNHKYRPGEVLLLQSKGYIEFEIQDGEIEYEVEEEQMIIKPQRQEIDLPNYSSDDESEPEHEPEPEPEHEPEPEYNSDSDSDSDSVCDKKYSQKQKNASDDDIDVDDL